MSQAVYLSAGAQARIHRFFQIGALVFPQWIPRAVIQNPTFPEARGKRWESVIVFHAQIIHFVIFDELQGLTRKPKGNVCLFDRGLLIK
jgi:hypothetical protein